jgi:hypothetical protein
VLNGHVSAVLYLSRAAERASEGDDQDDPPVLHPPRAHHVEPHAPDSLVFAHARLHSAKTEEGGGGGGGGGREGGLDELWQLIATSRPAHLRQPRYSPSLLPPSLPPSLPPNSLCDLTASQYLDSQTAHRQPLCVRLRRKAANTQESAYGGGGGEHTGKRLRKAANTQESAYGGGGGEHTGKRLRRRVVSLRQH